MNPIVAGNASAIEQGFSYKFSRGSSGGLEIVRTWIGTLAAIQAMIPTMVSNLAYSEIDAQQSPGSAIATLRARTATVPGQTAEIVEESLSLKWSTASLELNRNPAFIGITSARIAELEKLIGESSPSAPSNTTEAQYFRLRRRGVSTYIAKLPIITYNRVAPGQTTTQLDTSNSGYIFPAVEVPAASWFVISDINVGLSADSEGDFIIGWMLTADGDYLANGNVQLVEQYEFGLWESALYDVAT